MRHIMGVAAWAVGHNAVWWASAFITGAWVHNPEYWNLGIIVVILSFPLRWAPESWYPGNLEFLMMALNSLLWGACLYGTFLTLSQLRKSHSSEGNASV